MMRVAACVLLASAPTAFAKVYLHEKFDDAEWASRWTVPSKWKSAGEMGEFTQVTPENHEEDWGNKALKTGPDARFFGLSAPLSEPFDNTDKDLVLSYSVKNEQDIDCGGAYIKLLPDMDQDSFGGDTAYAVMFGPDKCGSTKRTHVIFHYEPKDDNLLIKDDVKFPSGTQTNHFTLLVRKDNSFEVFINKESVRKGDLKDAFDFLEPQEIKDPAQSKPADWVDEKRIPDPEDVKPEGWDDIPAEIPDPEATKPDDWDDEEDGEWEPPMMSNPEFQGPWKPKMIDNPAYKGEWVHPKIPNPDFVDDDGLYKRCSPACTHVGFELWQVMSGSVFDDIIVADDIEDVWKIFDAEIAPRNAKEGENFEAKKKEEDAAKEAAAAKRAEEAKKAQEEADAAAGEDEEEDDYGHEEL